MAGETGLTSSQPLEWRTAGRHMRCTTPVFAVAWTICAALRQGVRCNPTARLCTAPKFMCTSWFNNELAASRTIAVILQRLK